MKFRQTENGMIKLRPQLKIGDMVKLARPAHSDKMYRVANMYSNPMEQRKLRIRTRNVRNLGGEGYLDLAVIDENGVTSTFKRRDLWRVPNQPRDSWKKNKTPEQIAMDRAMKNFSKPAQKTTARFVQTAYGPVVGIPRR